MLTSYPRSRSPYRWQKRVGREPNTTAYTGVPPEEAQAEFAPFSPEKLTSRECPREVFSIVFRLFCLYFARFCFFVFCFFVVFLFFAFSVFLTLLVFCRLSVSLLRLPKPFFSSAPDVALPLKRGGSLFAALSLFAGFLTCRALSRGKSKTVGYVIRKIEKEIEKRRGTCYNRRRIKIIRKENLS